MYKNNFKMTVLITGATGLVGKNLTELLLKNGIIVHYLTTNKSKIETKNNYRGFYWNPQTAAFDEASLINVSAIIHLAGASIAKRWTKSYKQEIIESRTLSTNLLFQALKSNPNEVKQFISASAIGIYPDSETVNYTEDFTAFNNSFLSSVVVKWENAVNQIERLNISVSKIRIGLVLAKNGGVLQQILKPTQFGLGAAFGTGKNWQSWIHINDLSAIFMFVLQNKKAGIFNAVAPEPVSNYVLCKTVAETINKPFFLPNVPKIIMKLVLGEMHTLLFESQKVSCKKIENEGFFFQFKNLKNALKNILSV